MISPQSAAEHPAKPIRGNTRFGAETFQALRGHNHADNFGNASGTHLDSAAPLPHLRRTAFRQSVRTVSGTIRTAGATDAGRRRPPRRQRLAVHHRPMPPHRHGLPSGTLHPARMTDPPVHATTLLSGGAMKSRYAKSSTDVAFVRSHFRNSIRRNLRRSTVSSP